VISSTAAAGAPNGGTAPVEETDAERPRTPPRAVGRSPPGQV